MWWWGMYCVLLVEGLYVIDEFVGSGFVSVRCDMGSNGFHLDQGVN